VTLAQEHVPGRAAMTTVRENIGWSVRADGGQAADVDAGQVAVLIRVSDRG